MKPRMNFKYAFVREPSDEYKRCITSHPLQNSIDINKARTQHAIYCQTLSDLGLELIKLPRLNEHPDSCFIEDTAVIHNNKAFITRMGAKSRRGEVTSVEKYIEEYLEVQKAKNPAIIEGGDVIHLKNYLISGITQRTNQDGVNQMAEYLNIKVDTCGDPEIVHLKSYVTYIGQNTIIVTKRFSNHKTFDKFTKIVIEDKESYAANALAIKNTVLMAEGYDQAQSKVKEAGFNVIGLKMSEFQKCEGALTCLSLLF